MRDYDGPSLPQYEDGLRVDQGASGQLHFELAVSDCDADLPDTKLCAYMDTMDLGSEDEPQMFLTVRPVDPNGTEGGMYLITVSHMRRLCDLAEAMYHMGRAQWDNVSEIRLLQERRDKRNARAERAQGGGA